MCECIHNFVCFGDQYTNAKMDIHLILDHFGLKLVGKNVLQTDCDIKSYDFLHTTVGGKLQTCTREHGFGSECDHSVYTL